MRWLWGYSERPSLGKFAINVMGSVVMGVIVEWLALRGSAPQDLRLFLTTGILGRVHYLLDVLADAAGVPHQRGQLGLCSGLRCGLGRGRDRRAFGHVCCAPRDALR